ncbi:BMP family lipoprotein [Pseudoroseicyclus aestuarii]|uniref:Nucleoside-binding protein n=1 Tax=Pseudoroseicyclus aestuarii TaxID=1795041 RepID=A0A318STU7_9RHOB|nr:BMP family ABC transporter substrate-binding protein [Pseudoroseicyclus aestuarii]PYE84775.1 nucleoside-binding protein [Pseudoroseicyclus aestuarii]
MTLTTKLFSAAAGIALSAGAALAEPAIIYDLGGKFDKSFNESAFNGASRWAEETGESFAEVELQSEAQREQALRRFAEQGLNPIVTTGFSFASVLEQVAPDYPDTTFMIVDSVVDQPNVRSVVFDEHTGSYLVGVMAAMASESHTVGFVGGMDIPLIRKFACGYAQGVKATDPEAEVLANMVGTTPAAWADPVRGSELAQAQISQGADVIFAAAGASGIGVLQTVADEGVMGIGVDSNQNYLHPDNMLTSMVKRVDNSVYDAFSAGESLEPGVVTMGISDEGVGAAIDEYNEGRVTDEMRTALDEARAGIEDGSIEVHDYASDETCDAISF